MDLAVEREGKLSEEIKEIAAPEHINGEQDPSRNDATGPPKDEHQFQTAISAWRSMLYLPITVSY